MPREAENLIGKVFGTRKVVARAKARDYAGNKTLYWKTRCKVCGHTSDVQGGSLRRGAGCPKCRKEGNSSTSPVAPAPAKKRRTKKSKTMTVGQLRAALLDLPDGAQMRVHLVGKKGWATVRISDVTSAGGVVLLVSELPARIEPWRNE